jgi:hypothetical protein
MNMTRGGTDESFWKFPEPQQTLSWAGPTSLRGCFLTRQLKSGRLIRARLGTLVRPNREECTHLQADGPISAPSALHHLGVSEIAEAT